MMTMLLLAVMGSVYGQTTATDVLNRFVTGISGTSYTDWEYSFNSGAVYKGISAGGNGCIQLRASGNSGIVCTTSPGKVKKVTVVWNANTTSGRILDVFGKNTAYSAPSDLYGSANKGEKLGSMTYNVNPSTTELTIEDDYSYIGLRSNSNAMFLESITITWELSGTPQPVYYTVTYDCNGGTSDCPANKSVAEGTSITLADAPSRDGYTFDGWNNGTDTYDAGDSYTVNSDVTFTAQWIENSTGNELWVLTDLEDLTSDDIFVIVGNNGSNNYAMSNDNGTSNPPSAYKVIVDENGEKITSNVPDKIKWNLSRTNNNISFYPNGITDKWLYCTASNNGVRVGTNENNTFEIKSDYLYHISTNRYIGIYNSQDWRCYTSINSNITGQTFAFYKRVVVEEVQLNTDGYITYVTKNAIDWVKTLARNSQDGVDVHGYKVVDFGLDNGVSIVEYGVENLPSVTSTDKMYQEPIIPAGTPIIIQGKQGANYMVVADDENVAAPAGNLLLASDGNATTTDDVKLFVLQKIDKNGSGIENYAFYKLTKGRTIPEGKAYLSSDNVTLPDPDTPGFDPNNVRTANPIRVLVQTNNDPLVSDDAGIIDGIGTVAQDSEDGQVIYNLNGVRVNNPSKGIYVKNGKKVIIK